MPERDTWRVLYLRVIGRLYPDGRLRLRPCYLTTEAPWSDREGSGDSPLAVELFSTSGDPLGRYPLRVYSQCAFGRKGITEAVRAWVPFHPDAQTVRFTNRGRVVHEIRRSPEPPTVRLMWRPPDRVEGRQRVSWEARTTQSGTLDCFIRYSHNGGRTWQRVGWRTERAEMTIDFDELPGGEQCLVALVATDGLNTVTVESESFAVASKPCGAIIIAPIDGTVLAAGDSLQLIGQGYWMEESRVERERLRWTSSVDGELGRGANVRVDRLSDGQHRITLVAGEHGREGAQSVTISVKPRTDQGPASD